MLWKKMDLSTNAEPFTITTNFVYIPLDTTTKPFCFYRPSRTPRQIAYPKTVCKKKAMSHGPRCCKAKLGRTARMLCFHPGRQLTGDIGSSTPSTRAQHPSCGKAPEYPQDQMCRTTVLKAHSFFVQVPCRLDASFVQRVNDAVSA